MHTDNQFENKSQDSTPRFGENIQLQKKSSYDLNYVMKL